MSKDLEINVPFFKIMSKKVRVSQQNFAYVKTP